MAFFTSTELVALMAMTTDLMMISIAPAATAPAPAVAAVTAR